MRCLYVIPHFNHLAYIVQSVDSILKIMDPRWDQIFVINDDPNVDLNWLKDIDKEKSRVTISQDGKNTGQTVRWNQAIEEAIDCNFQWIAFQAADDYALPTKALMLNTEAIADVFYSDFLQMEATTNILNYIKSQNFDISIIKNRNFIAASTTFMRVEFLKKHKIRFDESLIYGEDWQMYNQLAKAGARFEYVHFPTAMYRNFTSNINVRNNPVKWQAERMKVQEAIKKIWQK